MIKIYVAGPYTKGSVEENVSKAIKLTTELIDLGLAPFCPHLSYFIDGHKEFSWETWIDIDLEFLRKCDALIRIQGDSKGADIEVKEAKEIGIKVFYSIEEVIEHYKLYEKRSNNLF